MGASRGLWFQARSAVDGAVVTQLLLELGRLKGWLVSGVGLGCRKCSTLMPQGIAFEVYARLGICPGCIGRWRPCMAN